MSDPIKEVQIFIPISMEEAKNYVVDVTIIDRDIDTGETLYILSKQCFVFSKEELAELLGKTFNDGVNNGLAITTHSNKFKSDADYIKTILS